LQQGESYRALFDEDADAIVLADAESGALLDANRAMQCLLGRSREELLALSCDMLCPDEERQKLWHALARPQSGEAIRISLLTREGRPCVMTMRVVPAGVDGRRVLFLRFRNVDEAVESARLWHRAVEACSSPIMIADAGDKKLPIVHVNPAFEGDIGYRAEEVLGHNLCFMVGSDREQPQLEHLRQALREQRKGSALLRNYRKNGEMFWNHVQISPLHDSNGMVTHYVGILRDVTADKHYEEELERLVNLDSLTGLPNRNLLQDRMTQAIAYAHRKDAQVGVLFVDLDRFKVVNDHLGHHIGDRLLQMVGQRLRQLVRETDTVARIGGDEFVLVISDLDNRSALSDIAGKLLHLLEQPLQVDGHELLASPSIGIACYPDDGLDGKTLLKHADTAMYRAKENGRNTFCFYAPQRGEAKRGQLAMGHALHRALDRGEFVLHYQPQVTLHNGEIAGVEALIRWQHPERGLMSPDEFVPVAEETDLIIRLGQWVLHEACAQATRWRQAGMELTVAVNLSARQFLGSDLIGSVRDILEQTDLPPHLLELELTESQLVHDPESMARMLRELGGLGVGLALDDFGTGYSSLSYLKRLPIQKVKIDRSFVRDVMSDADDATLVHTIITMAHNLRLNVVAEGVENEEQLVFLRSHHCNEVQGHYISRPLPAGEIAPFVERQRRNSGDTTPAGEEFPAVLLVDDDVMALEVLADILRLDGHRVLTALRPSEALRLLADHHVAVIVSDQMMPEMSGIELLRKVKHQHPDSIRIVLTGYTDIEVVTEAINEGSVYKFMTKPWSAEVLHENICEAFRLYEQQQGQARFGSRPVNENREAAE
jgi:diguanylate cyclase (GGDEF)-like protein/PAS domain S-box-containing protein